MNVVRRENEAEWLKEGVKPTYKGPAGSAYRVTLDIDPDDPRIGLEIGDTWLVFAPGAHPFWSWHVIFCVDLAEDRPGVPPAVKQYPEAQYELLVFALNPEVPVPDPRKFSVTNRPQCLEPPDAVVQFHGVDRDQAKEVIELAAHACARGHLIPDSDYRQQWNDTITTTVQHISMGLHD